MPDTTTKSLLFEVFGRTVLIVASPRGWSAYYLGSEGKRRPARDIVVPADVAEADMERYLGDLCHEWASPRHPEVKRLG